MIIMTTFGQMHGIRQVQKGQHYRGNNGIFTVDVVGARQYILRDMDGNPIELDTRMDQGQTFSKELVYQKGLKLTA